YSYHQTRDIAKVNVEGGKHEFIFATGNDERNPVFDKEGNIIFSSDETGIFNIYSYNPATKEKKQLTNVIGGAFMPAVNNNGDITYAGYTSDGYKIFYLKNNELVKEETTHSYIVTGNPPLDKDQPNGDITNFDIHSLKNFNDYETPDYEEETYGGAFSRLTFFPFIRIDNYNTANTFLEKVKPGLYVTSSDMLNRYAFFAGAAINIRLERDLFFIFDYRSKLPLLSSIGLRPELSAELYSTSRKSDVEIFFGVDSSGSNVTYDQIIPTDVTYNLFEFDFVACHRLFDRFQNLELRFIYSNYTATLGSFIIRTDGEPILYPTTDDTYFIGRDFRAKYSYSAIARTKDMDINPIGLEVDLIYDYEWNEFNEEGEYTIEDGLLKPAYKNFNFHRLELDASAYFPLWADHTLSTRIRIGTILGPPVADFFDFYLGGLIGFKAYPFYAISGNEIAWLNLTYRFPLWRNIDTKFGFLYFDKIFLSFHADIGNAWTGDIPGYDSFKKGAGTEVRIFMNSYYLFPSALFFNASYGFDNFERIVNRQVITYGKEWRFYGGLLFGFDIVNNQNFVKY
ncbi:biopolymer transporter Tol, partial [bacterium]|nr:biopolymer transporter Tol [bacterium]